MGYIRPHAQNQSMGVSRGGGGSGFGPYLLDNHKWLYVSLEFLVRITLEKRLGPSGPIASWERSVRPMWNTLMNETFLDRSPRSNILDSPMHSDSKYILHNCHQFWLIFLSMREFLIHRLSPGMIQITCTFNNWSIHCTQSWHIYEGLDEV